MTHTFIEQNNPLRIESRDTSYSTYTYYIFWHKLQIFVMSYSSVCVFNIVYECNINSISKVIKYIVIPSYIFSIATINVQLFKYQISKVLSRVGSIYILRQTC